MIAMPLPSGEWTPAQARGVMVEMAIEVATGWAHAAFLAIEHHMDALPPMTRTDRHGWGLELAGSVCLHMVDDAERVAVDLAATPDERRQIIVGRVAAFRARLEELMALPFCRGNA